MQWCWSLRLLCSITCWLTDWLPMGRQNRWKQSSVRCNDDDTPRTIMHFLFMCLCCHPVQHLSKVQTTPLARGHFESSRHKLRMLTRQQLEAAMC